MVDIDLRGGKVWHVTEYDGEEYDKTVSLESFDPGSSSPYTRERNCIDVDYPYLGFSSENALAHSIQPNTVILREGIDVEIEGSGSWFSESPRQRLNRVKPGLFNKIYGDKYHEFPDTNMTFVNSGSGLFPRINSSKPGSLYSDADLFIVSGRESLDASYLTMKQMRSEVAVDLEELAERVLEED